MDAKNRREPSNYRDDLDGKVVVYVELTRGKTAVVDADDWPHVVEQFGRRWAAVDNGRGLWSARKQVKRDDRRLQRLTLARAVTRAKDGERVETLNGDALDCRRANLEVIPKEGAREGRQWKANRRWWEKLEAEALREAESAP